MKRFIYFLLALIGFGAGACDNDGWGDVVAEYGCPHMNFSFKARVIDEAGNPIAGIEVQTKGHDFYSGNFSDAKGNIDLTTGMWPNTNIDVIFTDVDGEENGGEFETLELNISDKVEKVKEGDGRWYNGEYAADLGDVTMTLKAENVEQE